MGLVREISSLNYGIDGNNYTFSFNINEIDKDSITTTIFYECGISKKKKNGKLVFRIRQSINVRVAQFFINFDIFTWRQMLYLIERNRLIFANS